MANLVITMTIACNQVITSHLLGHSWKAKPNGHTTFMIQGRRQKHDGETIRAPIWNAKPNGHTNFMIGSKVAQCNKRHARSVLTAWRLRNNTHTVKHNGHTTFRIVNRLCAIVRAPFLVRWTQSGRPRLVSISKVFHNAPHQSIRLCRPLTFRIPRWLADYIPWSLQCLKGCASSPGTETNRAARVPKYHDSCRSKCNFCILLSGKASKYTRSTNL